MKRILCSAWVMFGLFATADARAQAPPPPSATVLAYYDGTPELATIYSEALAGFADEADYYLPVVQTADPVAFGDAVAAGDYDVFVAVTSDAATAIQWADAVPLDTNLAAFYPSGDPAYEITVRFVLRWPPDVGPPPSGSPANYTETIDITDDILGNGGMPLLRDGVLKYLIGVIVEEGSDAWHDFLAWLEQERRKALEEAANRLEKFADMLDNLPDPENVEVEITIELGVENMLPTAKVTLKVTTNAVNGAAIARQAASDLRPTTQPAP